MFSHFESAVDDIERTQGLGEGRLSLCKRTRRLKGKAEEGGHKLPYLNYKLGKDMRNIVAHGGSDYYPDEDKPDYTNLYEKLTLSELEKLEKQLIT